MVLGSNPLRQHRFGQFRLPALPVSFGGDSKSRRSLLQVSMPGEVGPYNIPPVSTGHVYLVVDSCVSCRGLIVAVPLTISCQVRRAVPLRSDSIRLHIVRAIRADIDINHNSIIIFEQFSTPPCIWWSVRLYVAHLCNICHIFVLCYVL